MVNNETPLKDCLSKYKREDLCQISWDSFGKEIENVHKQVSMYLDNKNIKIDAVIPILRGGNILATYLAYQLNLLRIIPVQYKYFFKDNFAELRQILEFPQSIFDSNEPLNFLLVEGNHCYGLTANAAASDLKKLFPNCNIIYVASSMDYSHRDAVTEADVSFCGRLTNDSKELTDEQCDELNIDITKSYIYPWEKVDEEWDVIQMKQSPFTNVEKIISSSNLIKSINLENN